MIEPPLTVPVATIAPLPDPPAPADRDTLPRPRVVDLNDGESLLIRVVRRLAAAQAWCPVTDYERARLGKHRADIRHALHRFLGYLVRHGRRKLRVGMPGLPVMTTDEQLLIAVMTAAQTQDISRLAALLPWLLGRSRAGDFLPLATVIGAGLALNGLMIRNPPPTGDRPRDFSDDSPEAARQDDS